MNLTTAIKQTITYKTSNINDDKSNVSCLYVQMNGDSMSGTIEAGDLVAIERCGSVVRRDGIYAFTREWLGKPILFIKRIKCLPYCCLCIISDNKHYEDFILNYDEQDDLILLGRVIGSMQIKRFL